MLALLITLLTTLGMTDLLNFVLSHLPAINDAIAQSIISSIV